MQETPDRVDGDAAPESEDTSGESLSSPGPHSSTTLWGADLTHAHTLHQALRRPPRVATAEAPRVSIVSGEAGQATAALAEALERAGLWRLLANKTEEVGRQLSIVVLVDLGGAAHRDGDGFFGCTPEWVEALLDLLLERANPQVALVAGGVDDPLSAADRAGYTFTTPGGVDYDLLDLHDTTDQEPCLVPGTLEGVPLLRQWLAADMRLVLAKSRSHSADYFALCARALAQVVSPSASTMRREEIPAEVLLSTPVDFAVVDAWQSFDGPLGQRAFASRHFIASSSVVLADWAAASKMGCDPASAAVSRFTLETLGMPRGYQVDGDLCAYAGWQNPSLLWVDSNRASEEVLAPVEGLVNGLRTGLQRTQRLFTPGSAAAEPQPTWVDSPSSTWGRTWLNYVAGAAADSVRAWHVVGAKDRLQRQVTGLGFNPWTISLAEVESVAPHLEELARQAHSYQEKPSGLRLGMLDGSVLFEYSQRLSIPFTRFCDKFPVSESVPAMNDYLGGACVVLQRDAQGRVTHQATRTIYLPQPNYQAFYGGKEIDVCKLEHATYSTTEHKVYWRTIKSLNSSATYDDGSVSFRQVADGTEITIVARQQFALPFFWQLVGIDKHQQLKARLVNHAYDEYCTKTLANFAAKFEGRDFRVGQSEATPAALLPAGLLPVELSQKVVDRAAEVFSDQGPLASFGKRMLGIDRPPPEHRDDGYAHFSPQTKVEDGANIPNPNIVTDATDPEETGHTAQAGDGGDTKKESGVRTVLSSLGSVVQDLTRATRRDWSQWQGRPDIRRPKP